MSILVSACLLGRNCKYNGGNNYNEELMEWLKGKDVIAVCPEVLAGMPIHRPCVEILNGRLVDVNGRDMDGIYRQGVKRALKVIEGKEIELAVLQSRSPTCGVHQIYDGSFSGKLTDGQGIFAKALAEAGYKVADIADFYKL